MSYFSTNYYDSIQFPQINWNNYTPPSFMGNNFLFPSYASSDSQSSNDSEKEKILAEFKKEKEAKLKAETNYQNNKEKNNAIAVLESQIRDIDKNQNNIKKAKNKDGSATISVERKDLGFWGNLGRGLANIGTAGLNICKSIVGFDENGTWQPDKALRNLAIAAVGVAVCACPALIPAAVPLIGGLSVGAVATGVGAVVGVVSGTVGAVKGAVDLANADTDREIDKAQQDIATGAIIGALSAFGLKGLKNTGAMTSNAAASATGGAGTSTNYIATAKNGTTLLGKTREAISNYGRDIYRGMQKISHDDKVLTQAQSGNFKVIKAMGAKAKNSISNLDWQKQYEAKLTEIENKLTTRIDRLNNKILAEADDAIRLTLENERTLLQNNLSELSNIRALKTKSSFDDLLKDTATPRDKAFLKDLKTLVKYKENAMRTLAGKPDKNSTVLEEYIPASELKQAPIKWYNPTTWTKFIRPNDYQYTIGGKNPGQFFKFTGKTLSSSSWNANKVLAQWETPYTPTLLFSQNLSKDEYEKAMNEFDIQRRTLEKNIKDIKAMDAETFVKQLKAQTKQDV